MLQKDMNERAQRLRKVYEYLFANHGIKSQKKLAEKIKIQPTGLSAAMNGNVAYLTDNLFVKICAAFPGVFNIDYLLTGEGELLLPIPRPEGQQVNDIQEVKYTSNLFDLAMQVIKDNEALHRQLQASIAELRSLIDRYGPLPGAESPRSDYMHMVAEDLDKTNPKK